MLMLVCREIEFLWRRAQRATMVQVSQHAIAHLVPLPPRGFVLLVVERKQITCSTSSANDLHKLLTFLDLHFRNTCLVA